jgi:hypothetical protein
VCLYLCLFIHEDAFMDWWVCSYEILFYWIENLWSRWEYRGGCQGKPSEGGGGGGRIRRGFLVGKGMIILGEA